MMAQTLNKARNLGNSLWLEYALNIPLMVKIGNDIITEGFEIYLLRDTILMAESEEELKSLLMKVKEESEKVGLTLLPNTQHSEN